MVCCAVDGRMRMLGTTPPSLGFNLKPYELYCDALVWAMKCITMFALNLNLDIQLRQTDMCVCGCEV